MTERCLWISVDQAAQQGVATQLIAKWFPQDAVVAILGSSRASMDQSEGTKGLSSMLKDVDPVICLTSPARMY